MEGEPILSEEIQTRYRSGIGILMILIKYSRPDISNPVRELSKVNDGATERQYKELLRVMKYVKDTKKNGLKYDVRNEELSKNHMWEIMAYCDSDFAGNKDSQKSVRMFNCLEIERTENSFLIFKRGGVSSNCRCLHRNFVCEKRVGFLGSQLSNLYQM